MIGETRCDGCHGNTAATVWWDVSGCFGNSPDDVGHREEKRGGDACLFELAQIADKQLKSLHSSEQTNRRQMKEETFVNVSFFRFLSATLCFTCTQLQVFKAVDGRCVVTHT